MGAVAACEQLAERFNLYALALPAGSLPVVREHEETWPEVNAGVVVVQGDLVFASMQGVLHAMEDVLGASEMILVLDVDRVTRVHTVAKQILQSAVDQLLEHDHRVVIVDDAEREVVNATAHVGSLKDARAWCERARSS